MKSTVETPSYYCTWAAQNYLFGCGAESLDVTELEGSAGADHANDFMREHIMFSPDGFAGFHPAARKELYFLLDAGWDVPNSMDRGYFGCLAPSPDRFPGCPENPCEALAYLNQKAKELGWAGVGIWIAAQEAPGLWGGEEHSAEQQEAYWKERLEWSEKAGVRYWKVDWGVHSLDIDFRARMTEWGRKYAPNLVIEHAYCQSCVNDSLKGVDGDTVVIETGRANPKLVDYQVQLLKHSDILRTYDVLAPLSVVQTIERVAALLVASRGLEPTGKALINCEDECYVAASLGLCSGIMRHPLVNMRPSGDPDLFFPHGERHFKQRMDEITRMVAWHQIMPAFGVADEQVYVSERILTDDWKFAKGDTWLAPAVGEILYQKAPAVVSRGMPLPEVTIDGEPPFVTASRHLDCAAVAAHGRTKVGSSWYEPLADVTVELDDGVQNIGVFGRFGNLRIKGMHLAGKKMMARDLCGSEWHEIPCNADKLVLNGETIDTIGLESGTTGDFSAPGLQLKIG